ncbi:hypothetical protein MOF01_08040 [Bacillus spizizenii]|nr:hypothetical protein [Bacillus spizizenii]
MKINVSRIERLEIENVYNGDCLLTSFAFGMQAEATIEFESGNRAEAVFEFPKADDLSFAEAERLIRKELANTDFGNEETVIFEEGAKNVGD